MSDDVFVLAQYTFRQSKFRPTSLLPLWHLASGGYCHVGCKFDVNFHSNFAKTMRIIVCKLD